ncbi:MAG: ParB/RepB/Spo0J family partition protein [Patescibacteria group bacterium]|jgi:ParB family chromosome partitioning protein
MPGTTLGRGLSSLIPGADAKNYWGKADQKAATAGERIERIPVTRIVANPQQPRERFERQGMEDLVASIKQHGILQPLVVTETPRGYELIAGERRLRAAKLANLREVPAIVRSATNQEKLELALVENLQRRDLNPVERARGYQRMVDEFNLTQDEVAKKVGQSRPVVANGLRILHLPPEMLAALSDGKIAEGHAKVLLGITDTKARQQLFKKMLEEHLSVRAVEDQSTQVRGHKRRAPASAELKAKASRIEGVLGAKVSLKPSGKGGKIVIDYNDAEELEGIVRRIERGT